VVKVACCGNSEGDSWNGMRLRPRIWHRVMLSESDHDVGDHDDVVADPKKDHVRYDALLLYVMLYIFGFLLFQRSKIQSLPTHALYSLAFFYL
jgi:hypothetical protein